MLLLSRLQRFIQNSVCLRILSSAVLSTNKLQYFKITVNRVTATFFLFSVVLCFAQGILQSFLYSVDTRWRLFTSTVESLSNINSTVFLQYTSYNSWEICHDTPNDGSSACMPFVLPGKPVANVTAGFRRDTVSFY
jgi:hypothetical protein